MFGISDPGIYLAYLMVFLCVVFALVFGIINWNKGNVPDEESLKTNIKWERKEQKIKKELFE